VKGHIFNEGSLDWGSGFKMLCGTVKKVGVNKVIAERDKKTCYLTGRPLSFTRR